MEGVLCVAASLLPTCADRVGVCLQDMGCGPGRFLLLLCRHHTRQQQQPMNYLGLEIRQPVRTAARSCIIFLRVTENKDRHT